MYVVLSYFAYCFHWLMLSVYPKVIKFKLFYCKGNIIYFFVKSPDIFESLLNVKNSKCK